MKFLLSLFLLLPTLAESRQLSDLRSDARLLANDTGSSRNRFTDAQINSFINEAQRIAAQRTWCIQKSTSFLLATGTTYYPTKSDFIAPLRLTLNYRELEERSPQSLHGSSVTWESQGGEPRFYFLNFSSRGLIGFSPFPNVNNDTGTIRMDYAGFSVDLSANGDIPFDNIVELLSYHHALSYYAAGRMAEIDGRFDSAKVFKDWFETLLQDMQAKCMYRPNFKTGILPMREQK